MEPLTVKQLLQAGIHYGHRASRWNPKMRPYIYGKRKLIHIVDIRETIRGLITAAKLLEKLVRQGRDVVFVGTKRQARSAVRSAAERTGMHFVSRRWIGGTLTNFDVIRSRVKRMEELEELEATGEIDRSSKKEGAALRRELRKIKQNLEGIRGLNRLPGAVVVIDPVREDIVVCEANVVRIPVIALADTDCDPDLVDVLIPGNDDAMRAIQVVLDRLCEAVAAGLAKRQAVVPGEVEPAKSAQEREAGRPQPSAVHDRDANGKKTPSSARTPEPVKGRPKGRPRGAKARAAKRPAGPPRESQKAGVGGSSTGKEPEDDKGSEPLENEKAESGT